MQQNCSVRVRSLTLEISGNDVCGEGVRRTPGERECHLACFFFVFCSCVHSPFVHIYKSPPASPLNHYRCVVVVFVVCLCALSSRCFTRPLATRLVRLSNFFRLVFFLAFPLAFHQALPFCPPTLSPSHSSLPLSDGAPSRFFFAPVCVYMCVCV